MMTDDTIEFHQFSIRKTNLNHTCEMIDLQRSLHSGKYPTKCLIKKAKTILKILKMKDDEVSKVKAAEEEWKNSEKFTDWKKKMDEKQDEDIFKYDQDPEGYTAFFDTRDIKNEPGIKLATLVSEQNPEHSEAQYQALKLFIF